MRTNLKRIREELAKKCKAGPSSDYQDLWLTINNLLRNFEDELQQRLKHLDNKLSRADFLINNALLLLDGSEIPEKCERDYKRLDEILTDLRSEIEEIRKILKEALNGSES